MEVGAGRRGAELLDCHGAGAGQVVGGLEPPVGEALVADVARPASGERPRPDVAVGVVL